MKVGLFLPQESHAREAIEAYETMTRVAQEAEALGFSSVWLFDHMNSIYQPDKLLFECWMSVAALARDTRRVRIGQVVTCNGFRNPALLAKMASTVDVLSHGRLEVGIGAGWHEQECHAYGFPFPDTPTRLRQLREAVTILKALWTQEHVHFEGRYYRVQGAINQPKGAQHPHIPLLIGGKGEQITLRLVARYANACNFTHLSLEEIQHKFSLLEQYCEEYGRDPGEIRHTIFVNGVLAATDEQAHAIVTGGPGKFSPEEMRVRGLLGSPMTVRQRLNELEQAGVDEVIVSLHSVTKREPLRLLAEAFAA
uniref:LLM class F420-dependent oxidoreductase n=1 Tax=Thermosporothrix sp. COM3 TaxID=2490863 RepID=A0A455SE55_9CHLR|nr:LLM class F420-dependent oxidoreductase [Thermosporothrix sp. COM3]